MSGQHRLFVGGKATRMRGTVRGSTGNDVIATEADADPSEAGLGGPLWRYVTTGILNSDFAFGTPGLAFATRAPDYWTWNVVSGSAVTGQIVEDSTVGSGRYVQLSLAAGASGDEAYLEQIVKIIASTNRSHSFSPYAFLATDGATSVDVHATVSIQYLKRDGVTTTGSGDSNSFSTATISTGFEIGLATGTTARIPPADAYFARVRYGMKRRAGGSTSATGAAKLFETFLVTGRPRLHLVDRQNPTSYSVASLGQFNGFFSVTADADALSGTTDTNRATMLSPRRVLSTTSQTVVAGTPLPHDGELLLADSAGNVTVTAAPTIADGAQYQVMTIQNIGSFNITLQDQGTLASSNLRLSTTTFVMGPRDSITLVFNPFWGWTEIARTNVL